jgi:cell division protein FtsB
MAFFRTSQDIRAKRRRLLTYALLAGATVLMVNALVGEHGYLATLRSQRDADAITEDIDKIKAESRDLKERTERLKNDPAALEEAARRDLLLIMPGETVVIINNAKPAPAPAAPPAAGK